MNKRFTAQLLFLLFFACISLSKAQGPIQIDTTSNWQQWISGILGGNCVQISNVQFTQQSGSAARFTNASNLGLTEGIVLSTGLLGPQLTAVPSLFLSESFPVSTTDTLLEQYAIQEIGYTGNATSYDATRIEFDFTAPSNQQVNIRFIFASEEYPEFAPPNNSFFNDIFGFFVAEQGSSNFQNIANVPGTTLPVTIGNINAVNNTQFYIESQAGLQFAFDGYTTPITATFDAIGGVTYHMVIAISDIGDPNYDSAVFLELNSNDSQSIHGTAYVNNEPLENSAVKLYGFNIDPGAFDSLAVALTDTLGNYSFSSINQGLYLVQVVPDAVVYPQAIPIYFPGVVLWEDATAVGIACDSLDINGPGMIFNTGPGQITGFIGQDPFGGRLRYYDLVPYEGVNVFLQDSASGEWRGFDKTDEDGAYAFDNLSTGTYYVIPDVAGIPVEEYRKVVISDTAFSYENMSYIYRDSSFQTHEFPFFPPLLNFDTVGIYTVFWTLFSPSNNFAGIDMMKFKGDTLIDGITYHALWADVKNSEFNAYNEDSALYFAGFRQEGSTLYIRLRAMPEDWDSTFSNREFIYFDANWAIGDTIYRSDNVLIEPYSWNNDTYVVVRAIDTVIVNSKEVQRWMLQSRDGYYEIFAIGFGYASGFASFGFMQNTVCLIPPAFMCYTDSNNVITTGFDIFQDDEFYFWHTPNECWVIGGFDQLDQQNAIKVFPNPGNNYLQLESEFSFSGQMLVHDISGRVVSTQPVNSNSNLIDTSTWGSGLYFLTLVDQTGNRSTIKWIKE